MTQSRITTTNMKIKHVYYILGVIAATLVFVILSQISQEYSDLLQNSTEQSGIIGVISYIAIMAVSIVVAPIGTGFLLPVAANSWGPLLAATYSITGWTIGSMIAFWLSKKYGLKLVKNVKTVERLQSLEKAIPRRHIFFAVVLLRMSIPVDLLSYALGIFSSMGYWMFFWSTIIGISPFAIIMMYAATSTVTVQIAVSVVASFVMFAGLYYIYTYSKSSSHSETEKVDPGI